VAGVYRGKGRKSVGSDGHARSFVVLAVCMAAAIFAVAAAGFANRLSPAAAADDYMATLDLRDAPVVAYEQKSAARRAALVHALEPERLIPPVDIPRSPDLRSDRPKIVIIFDDMGLSKGSFDRIMEWPGPVTFSFLPYARDLQPMVDRAKLRGDAVMLHLPMEAMGSADPGPKALRRGMTDKMFDETLDWNFARFDGYVGVNNHMGSALTRDNDAMEKVLARVRDERKFFLDSVTSSRTVAQAVGARVGATVISRDIFLDAEPGEDAVRRQLRQLETIARETGFAIAICHPRDATLNVLGPWLTTAPLRGFELATVQEFVDGAAISVVSAHGALR
jgi:polysaccharide deacetylase 2 family uncharacterized protein YibQ